MKSRGERLKERRLALGLTMAQVAKEVGLSTPGVQNLERGDAMPSLEIGVKLANLYRRSVYWVIDGSYKYASLTPIVGTTDAGPDPDWMQDTYNVTLGFLPVTYGLFNMFGLRITNSSPSVRYTPGDVLLLCEQKPLGGGDEIFVSMANGCTEFGWLIQQSETSLVFEELKNRQRRIYEQNEINNVWKIIGSVSFSLIMNKADE